MDRGIVLGLIVCCACSARLGGIPGDGTERSGDGGIGTDGQVDAEVLGAWSAPAPIPGADDPTNSEDDPTVNSTATELIYGLVTPAAPGDKNLYEMKRATKNDPWGAPVALAVLNTAVTEESPRFSTDDLTLYFGRNGDIYQSTRVTVGSAWGAPTLVSSVSIAGVYEKWLAVCTGGYFMISRANGTNGQDLYDGTLGMGTGTLVASLSSTSNEISTFLSKDCLTVYFASNRSGQTQIYTATRATINSPWPAPSLAPSPFDDGTDDEDPWISTDQRIFVFAGVRGGAATKDLYMSTR